MEIAPQDGAEQLGVGGRVEPVDAHREGGEGLHRAQALPARQPQPEVLQLQAVARPPRYDSVVCMGCPTSQMYVCVWRGRGLKRFARGRVGSFLAGRGAAPENCW